MLDQPTQSKGLRYMSIAPMGPDSTGTNHTVISEQTVTFSSVGDIVRLLRDLSKQLQVELEYINRNRSK